MNKKYHRTYDFIYLKLEEKKNIKAVETSEKYEVRHNCISRAIDIFLKIDKFKDAIFFI